MSESNLHRLVWERFSNGDENALLEIYNQHYLGLINYGQKLINNREFVNGCLVDMLVEFWKKRETLAHVENVRSYLMTSFRRFILHKVEEEKKRDQNELKYHQVSEQFQISYEEHIVQMQTNESLKSKITKAFGKLSDRQKELIELKFFEDLDYDEIAVKCGITKRTAYNIVYDALKILKEELNDGSNKGFSLVTVIALLALVQKTL
jgi:RNA polymerase sigma factor (sigma-70 family)